jgi:hypothetical protein
MDMWNGYLRKAKALGEDDHVSYPQVNAIVWHAVEELLDSSQTLMDSEDGTLIAGNNDALLRLFTTLFFVGYDAGKNGVELEKYSGICSHTKGMNN